MSPEAAVLAIVLVLSIGFDVAVLVIARKRIDEARRTRKILEAVREFNQMQSESIEDLRQARHNFRMRLLEFEDEVASSSASKVN